MNAEERHTEFLSRGTDEASETQRLTLFLAVLSSWRQRIRTASSVCKRRWSVKMSNFVALKMRWTMDALDAADLLYDAGNAAPNVEIWKKLAAEVMANVLGQHYFTEVWRNGAKVKF